MPVAGLIRGYARGVAKEAWLRGITLARLRDVESRNPILVYQMGKVGSSTVVATLERAGVLAPVLHIHTLRRSQIAHASRQQRRRRAPFLPEHLVVSRVLQAKLARRRFPCRVITLTREPVQLAISLMFEDWHTRIPHARRPDGGWDDELVKRAVDAFLDRTDPSRWFQREVEALTGVDVMAEPYDREQGYSIFRGNLGNVLLLRMEDMDRSLPRALSAFLGGDPGDYPVVRANVGARKAYADVLRRIKQSYAPPAETALRMKNSRYYRHFYS